MVKQMGTSSARIHDLWHTYAVNCIQAEDNIKTVQSNLGQATAAFTLDVYGHFMDDRRAASSQRDHVTDFAQIAAYGVMTTPALVVGGKVVAFGKVLKRNDAKALIQAVRK